MTSRAVHWFSFHAGAHPMVLFHGFTGAPTSWEAVARALPPGRTVLAPALPGHHPDVPVASGFIANVDRVAERLEGCSAGPCHLVGYSLGARTALGLAARHPGLVRRLTLIGVHPGLPEDARAQRIAADQRWIALLRERGIHAFAGAWQKQPIFATQERLPGPLLERQRQTRLAHDPEALARSLEHMGLGAMPSYRGAIATLPMPVTLVTGALDPKFTALARDLAALRPSARVVTLADCGHNPVLEQPDELARMLTELP